MTSAVPRTLVADALGVDADDLPPGDLPLDRLATRFLAFLAAGDEGNPALPGHPDAWTFALLDTLSRDHPPLALAAIRAMLAVCDSPERVAEVAAGPLEDLVAENGPAVIDALEALAATAPRFAYALTGVWQRGHEAPLLWARIEAARRGVPGLDDGAPLPAADGL